MDSRIPLPTDNVFKFYALFGLALFISGMLGFAYVSTSTNDQVHQFVRELNGLDKHSVDTPAGQALRTVLERRIEASVKNREFFVQALGLQIGVAVCLMAFGFWRWHTVIQPKQDEMTDLHIKKLKAEIEREAGQ